ncbi:MAG: hypothetical protein EOP88_07635 [Verrucomicrobiaceae bacterium]|nr:MAG: hypothetical protein EOP88_07635 [Verrucomicrobiaceae bacterium]
MKTSQWAAISAAVILVGTLVAPRAHAQTSAPQAPAPTGLTASLDVDPMVPAGQRTPLSWSINYPSVIKKYVNIVPPGGSGGSGPGTITPTTNLYADVRIIGQGVTVTTNNTGYTFVPTEAAMSINNSSTFTRIFYGTNPQINPGSVTNLSSYFGSTYANNMIQTGKPVRFAGRYYYDGAWGTQYKSNSGDNVRFLVNGDTPPSNVPQYNAPSLESFLRPYLDTTGKVKIGPMDVIVFMELTHSSSQKSDPGYDLQDLVLLVTFRKP